MSVIVVPDKDAVITKLCDLIQTAAKESIDRNGCFSIGLSGNYFFNDNSEFQSKNF